MCLHLSQGNEQREKNVETYPRVTKSQFQKRLKLFLFLSPHILITSSTFAPISSSLAPPPKKHMYPVNHSQVLVSVPYLLSHSQFPPLPSVLPPHPLLQLPSSPTWIAQQAPYWSPYFLPASLQSSILQSQ